VCSWFLSPCPWPGRVSGCCGDAAAGVVGAASAAGWTTGALGAATAGELDSGAGLGCGAGVGAGVVGVGVVGVGAGGVGVATGGVVFGGCGARPDLAGV
jgi:hypothetical protein